jgi:hypothetical protein
MKSNNGTIFLCFFSSGMISKRTQLDESVRRRRRHVCASCHPCHRHQRRFMTLVLDRQAQY